MQLELSNANEAKWASALVALKITLAAFYEYLDMFTRPRRTDKFILRRDTWQTIKHSWSAKDVLDHLQHNKTIGLFPGEEIDYIMIDLDCHNPKDRETLLERYQLVLKSFGGTPLVFTSSDSGGIRVMYFLDKMYPREVVKKYAEYTLGQNKAILLRGQIEVLANKTGDRLPFGAGSFLADLSTLRPKTDMSLSDMIGEASRIRKCNRLQIDTTVFVPAKRPVELDSFVPIVDKLRVEGLWEGITTNDALLNLNYDCQGRRGMPPEETKSFLKAWIRQKHNGCSTRANDDKFSAIDAHIDRVVECFDPDMVKYQGLNNRPNAQLSLGDIENILSMFSDRKLQQACFSLLLYTKQRGTLMTEEHKPELSNSKQDKTTSTPPVIMSNLYKPRNQQCWRLELPRKAIDKLDGFLRSDPNITLKKLEEAGVISLLKRHSVSLHKCRVYQVNFTFDDDSRPVVSLDEGIQLLLTPEMIKEQYSRHHASCLLN